MVSNHQILSIYSNAFKSDTAHTICGVPASNFCHPLAVLKVILSTSSIIPPPHRAGFKFLI
jgi:hypothetical protein